MTKVSIGVSHPIDQESAVVDIEIDARQFAELSRQSDDAEPVIEVLPEALTAPWRLTLREFRDLLEQAERLLLDVDKPSERKLSLSEFENLAAKRRKRS